MVTDYNKNVYRANRQAWGHFCKDINDFNHVEGQRSDGHGQHGRLLYYTNSEVEILAHAYFPSC